MNHTQKHIWLLNGSAVTSPKILPHLSYIIIFHFSEKNFHYIILDTPWGVAYAADLLTDSAKKRGNKRTQTTRKKSKQPEWTSSASQTFWYSGPAGCFPFSWGPVPYFPRAEVVATQDHACHTALKHMAWIYDRRHLTTLKRIFTCLLLVLNDLYEHFQ